MEDSIHQDKVALAVEYKISKVFLKTLRLSSWCLGLINYVCMAIRSTAFKYKTKQNKRLVGYMYVSTTRQGWYNGYNVRRCGPKLR